MGIQEITSTVDKHKIKSFPTKHLCILVQAPYFNRGADFLVLFRTICIKFGADLKNAETAPTIDAI